MAYFDDGRLWLAGAPRTANADDVVALHAPSDQRGLAHIHQASTTTLLEAIDAGVAAEATMASTSTHQRRVILEGIVAGLRARRAEFVDTIVAEAGKPRRLAEGEVARAITTFELAAAVIAAPLEHAQPLDGVPGGEGRLALRRRRPLGLCVAITPFNFPLNLVAHKLAPAFAAGCPVVLKPAEQTPLTSLLLARICQEAGLPDGGLSVVPADRRVAGALVDDPRPRLLSFTGSDAVGVALHHRFNAAKPRRCVLELGGNAACIVDETADLDLAIPRLITGGYAYAGQVCISVQQVLVHRARLEETRARLLDACAAVAVGDPDRDDVVVGPLISDAAADRVTRWIEEAVDGGARVFERGARDGRLLGPTLLEDVPDGCHLDVDEAFGPVMYLRAFDDLDDAFARINTSRFGLQTGIFSNDLQRVLRAGEVLDVGAIIHDDVPTFRVDQMPYGGVKASGLGVEGLPWALEDYTVARTLVLRQR